MVVLHHVNDANELFAVVGTAPGYVANVTPAPNTAKWTVISAPTLLLPDGTLVVPGSSKVRLRSVSNPALILKSTGSPAQPALGAADASSDHRFGYFCQAGDTCAR